MVQTVQKPVEIPQLQILDKVPTVLTAQKLVEIPQLQIVVKVVDLPTVVQRQVSMVLTVQTPLEISQLQILDKVVVMPFVVQQQVLADQTVQKTVEVPQWQFIDNVIGTPVLAQRQDPPLRPAGTSGNCGGDGNRERPCLQGPRHPCRSTTSCVQLIVGNMHFVCGYGNVGKGCSCPLRGSDAPVFIAECDPSVPCRRA